MNYKERFSKVFDFIGQHLDEDISIDHLSSVACFSKFHFHRLFTVYTGLSLKNTSNFYVSNARRISLSLIKIALLLKLQ